VIETFILDPFYLYLTMNRPRDLHAIAERYGLPEAELRTRAWVERWNERVRTFEVEIPGRDEFVHRQIQLWLTVLVILAAGGPLPGTRLGSVAVGTDLMVQVQEIG